MEFRDGAKGQRPTLKPNLEPPPQKIRRHSYTRSWIFGCLEMVAGNWTSDGDDVEKHCYTSALVGADFKAADADKADARAQLFSNPTPPPRCSSSQPPFGSRHRAEN